MDVDVNVNCRLRRAAVYGGRAQRCEAVRRQRACATGAVPRAHGARVGVGVMQAIAGQ